MKSVELSYGSVDVREAKVKEWPELYECAADLANPYQSGEALEKVVEKIYATWTNAKLQDPAEVALEDVWKILEAAAGPRGKALRKLPELFAEYMAAFFGSEGGKELIKTTLPKVTAGETTS
ncbi:MAG: hypothetical protein QMD66_06655 [Actinomycetota bacterium]|nr:hypothetical protein [Actinomycetota bacterium]NPV54555.1 hypothetical protein [Bacillota bacterium]